MAKIRDRIGEEGEGWFAGMVVRKVGDGDTTYFLLDQWVGDVPLCRRSSRLFNLSKNKLATVVSMLSPGWELGGGAWQWRRRLWAWEEELVEECRLFISNIFCSLIFQILGSGFLTLQGVIQCVLVMRFSRLGITMCWMKLRILFGILGCR